MSEHDIYSGMAALSICEALLLALNDAKVLPNSEIMGILEDAASSHEQASGSGVDLDVHRAVALILNRIIARGPPARRF